MTIEGPEEINPDHLAPPEFRVELLIKNPEAYQRDESGTETVSVDPRWLQWSPVPLIGDHQNCEHTYSVCSDCADSWGIDYFMRIFHHDKQVWMSPDHPDSPDSDSGNPPLYNL